ncbi:hypothetical protein DCS_08058 [Drechmeria coniospora]|uniref:TRAPPC10/Trs130 N-terminal domain-containing protein n=1 Tax=Drechmeria coniospora TaxID=98403 RepID=A0A151GG98_DRECN|nr:hypothetical protein DCS_08058 [Drechmeria coniospora]KYK56092.1 hypothetical protein DCS_08058 [Drechmeria coniospora]
MEQQYSTSKVTVEYFDPHDVFKLLASGLNPRLPLRNLHWQSHAGPLRSIDTLHVELVPSGTATHAAAISTHRESDASRDDGFQTQNVGGPSSGAAEAVESTQSAPAGPGGSQRRHQIPGLRRTSYLKILFVRCDDSESYKTAVRSEVREWIKTNTPKKVSNQEMHDAFEWLIVHVILPNTAAATQPRTGGKSDGGAPEKGTASSRWRTGSTPLMEKFRSDFNSSAKGTPDRIAQVRIGINDVPYDLLPRVVPAVPPSGYSETEQDTESAWGDFMGKIKSLILTSFDQRVSQYEDDIKEKDAQRSLPGWNFCTFFILKEGLARGFESVGLVEDALVGYDELSIGLDSVLREQAATGEPESHGGALLAYTDDLEAVVKRALTQVSGDDGDAEAEDLQSKPTARDPSHEIVISSTSKPYRDLILANKVSAFDFRCYLFARQVSLLLRLGNAWVTKEELIVKLKDQQDSVLHGVAPPVAPQPRREEPENLAMLAEICQRTLEFIPSISQVMRQDIMAALAVAQTEGQTAEASPLLAEMVDNIVSSFAFSVAQQILAQTSSSALPIPPTTLTTVDGHEPKSSIPEPKTMMHPARSSSLHSASSRHPPGTEASPGSGRRLSASDADSRSKFLKIGLEELAARRAELHLLSRSILSGLGKKRGWSNGWDEAPRVSADQLDGMEDVSLDDGPEQGSPQEGPPIMAGISEVLRTAADNSEDFHRLYEILTDKSLRHFTVANYEHAIKSCLADLAVLKVHMGEHRVAANYFSQIQPFYGSSGWTELELSILVMYSQCLDRLESHNDYVRVALDLLTKACAAEKERLQQNSALPMRAGIAGATGAAPLHGVAEKLFRLSKSLSWEAKAPLSSLFTGIRLNGAPEYHDGRDSCSLSISLHGLLPETITFDSAKVKITCVDGGPCRDLVFETNGQVILSPGRNSLTVDCNSVCRARHVSGQPHEPFGEQPAASSRPKRSAGGAEAVGRFQGRRRDHLSASGRSRRQGDGGEAHLPRQEQLVGSRAEHRMERREEVRDTGSARDGRSPAADERGKAGGLGRCVCEASRSRHVLLRSPRGREVGDGAIPVLCRARSRRRAGQGRGHVRHRRRHFLPRKDVDDTGVARARRQRAGRVQAGGALLALHRLDGDGESDAAVRQRAARIGPLRIVVWHAVGARDYRLRQAAGDVAVQDTEEGWVEAGEAVEQDDVPEAALSRAADGGGGSHPGVGAVGAARVAAGAVREARGGARPPRGEEGRAGARPRAGSAAGRHKHRVPATRRLGGVLPGARNGLGIGHGRRERPGRIPHGVAAEPRLAVDGGGVRGSVVDLDPGRGAGARRGAHGRHAPPRSDAEPGPGGGRRDADGAREPGARGHAAPPVDAGVGHGHDAARGPRVQLRSQRGGRHVDPRRTAQGPLCHTGVVGVAGVDAGDGGGDSAGAHPAARGLAPVPLGRHPGGDGGRTGDAGVRGGLAQPRRDGPRGGRQEEHDGEPRRERTRRGAVGGGELGHGAGERSRRRIGTQARVGRCQPGWIMPSAGARAAVERATVLRAAAATGPGCPASGRRGDGDMDLHGRLAREFATAPARLEYRRETSTSGHARPPVHAEGLPWWTLPRLARCARVRDERFRHLGHQSRLNEATKVPMRPTLCPTCI